MKSRSHSARSPASRRKTVWNVTAIGWGWRLRSERKAESTSCACSRNGPRLAGASMRATRAESPRSTNEYIPPSAGSGPPWEVTMRGRRGATGIKPPGDGCGTCWRWRWRAPNPLADISIKLYTGRIEAACLPSGNCYNRGCVPTILQLFRGVPPGGGFTVFWVFSGRESAPPAPRSGAIKEACGFSPRGPRPPRPCVAARGKQKLCRARHNRCYTAPSFMPQGL